MSAAIASELRLATAAASLGLERSNCLLRVSRGKVPNSRRCVAATVTATVATAAAGASSSSSSPTCSVQVRIAREEWECQEIAALRAACKFEDDFSRFSRHLQQEYKKSEQECLKNALDAGLFEENASVDNPWVIAIATMGERVVGTCDVSMRRRVQDRTAVGVRIFSAVKGVDPQDDTFAYVENVCVDADYRCQGIGRSLVDACVAEADTWGVGATYTEVELSNDHAYNLYTKCGFEAPETTQRAIQAMTPDTPRVGKFVVLRRNNCANG